jgi:hypothetical protein
VIQPAGGSDWALVSEEAKKEQLSIAANNEARNLHVFMVNFLPKRS